MLFDHDNDDERGDQVCRKMLCAGRKAVEEEDGPRLTEDQRKGFISIIDDHPSS